MEMQTKEKTNKKKTQPNIHNFNKRLYEVLMIRVCHTISPAFENEENDQLYNSSSAKGDV